MTADDNKQLIVRYLATLDSGDQERALALVDEIVAHDYVAYWAGSTYRGRDTLKSHIANAYVTFAEMRHTIEDNLADGDTVVTRVRFRAMLRGDFLGIPAAGKQIECPIIYITKFRDGRFSEVWLDWDSLFTVAQQLRIS
jgi:steroid delta-isomerase-like uncharacterized protein